MRIHDSHESARRQGICLAGMGEGKLHPVSPGERLLASNFLLAMKWVFDANTRRHNPWLGQIPLTPD